METVEQFIPTLEAIYEGHVKVPYSVGDITSESIVDADKRHFLLVSVGWHKHRRIHGLIAHVDIINDKFYIQRDGTEYGIAGELEDAGVPKNKIVLAWQTPRERAVSGYALE